MTKYRVTLRYCVGQGETARTSDYIEGKFGGRPEAIATAIKQFRFHVYDLNEIEVIPVAEEGIVIQ